MILPAQMSDPLGLGEPVKQTVSLAGIGTRLRHRVIVVYQGDWPNFLWRAGWTGLLHLRNVRVKITWGALL